MKGLRTITLIVAEPPEPNYGMLRYNIIKPDEFHYQKDVTHDQITL
jgi:hypothetical protein